MSGPIAARPDRGLDVAALMPWVIGLVTGIDYFDNAAVRVLRYIAGGVHASADELVWASSAYALGAVLGILQQHAWVERLGYWRYLAICMFAFAIGRGCWNSSQPSWRRSTASRRWRWWR